MVDVSGFIAFIKDYSRENDEKVEISFNTEWNKDEAISVSIYNFEDDGDENYLLDCRITDKDYNFDNIGDWNLDILEKVLACMRYKNCGVLPKRIYINGYIYNDSFKSVRDLFNTYAHAKYSNKDDE